jgi:hypothetical protein
VNIARWAEAGAGKAGAEKGVRPAPAAEPDPEAALIDDISGFHADPLGYVLYAFDWAVPAPAGGEAPGGPDVWQAEMLREVGRAVRDNEAAASAGLFPPAKTIDAAPAEASAATASSSAALQFATATGHGTGKTALTAWLILWAMSTRPHLAGVVTANTRPQLMDKTWRELAKWHKRALNAHWFGQTATHFYQVDNPDTWFVAAVAWSKDRPEAFAGLHERDVLVIYDEASAIDDVIWETTEGAMTTPGAMWFAFGNPTRNTGRFRECFGRFRHRWHGRMVDSRQAKMANPAQIRQWREDYGEDSDFFKVRVKGEFPSASFNQLIPLDVAEAAMTRELPPGAVAHMPRVWGLDVARYGDDRSVLAERQGRSGKIILTSAKIDLMTLAGRVAELWRRERPEALFIDDGGLGGGVTDRLRQLGLRPIAVNFAAAAREDGAYANKRAEMWFALGEWLKTACLARDQRLKDDLSAPVYGYDRKDRYLLESKDDLKKRGLASPDYADALALTFAAPVMARRYAVAGGGDELAQAIRAARSRPDRFAKYRRQA